MSGIAGMVSNAGADAHAWALSRMTQPLLNPFPEGMFPSTAGRVESAAAAERGGLTSVSLKSLPSPLAFRDLPGGRVWLALNGAVFLDDDPATGEALPPMPERLLDRFLQRGVDALCGLNGTYALAVFEEGPGRLTLVKDRTGYGRLFYWVSGDRLMFASEIKSISWHPDLNRAIHPVAVADLFLYRSPAEDRTLFCDIRSLPPASVLTFERGEMRLRQYWKLSFDPAYAPDRPDVEWADAMAEKMRAAVRRRALPDTCLLITGGLDSRIVGGFFQQLAPQHGLRSATIGLPTGGDVLFGSDLARSLGIPHLHLPLDTAYLERYAPACSWKSEARNGSYASWIIAAAPYLEEMGVSRVLTGLYGNFISGTYLSPALLKARTLEEGLRALEGFIHPYYEQLQAILRPDVFASAGRESAAAVQRIFYATETDSLVQRADAFYLSFRVGRQANTEDSLGHAVQALEPYLDNDLMDFAILRMPPAARARAMFNPLMVLRHLPNAAAVPLNHHGRTLAQEVAIRQSPLRAMLDGLRGRVQRRLERDLLRRRNGGQPAAISVPHSDAIREGSRAFVRGLFAQTDLYDDFFDPAAARALLENHLTGRSFQYMTIDALVSFILWRSQFAGREIALPIPAGLPERVDEAKPLS